MVPIQARRESFEVAQLVKITPPLGLADLKAGRFETQRHGGHREKV